MRFGIPSIEASDDREGARVGRPHAEDDAGLSVVGDEVGSHLVVEAVVTALVEEVEVLVGEELGSGGDGFRAHGVAELRAGLSLQNMRPNTHRDIGKKEWNSKADRIGFAGPLTTMYIRMYFMYIRC